MDLFTIGWIVIGLAVVVVEGVALMNSRTGDTLSEHLWAWLGVRTSDFNTPMVTRQVSAVGIATVYVTRPEAGKVTPKWTLRVARIAFLSAMLWFTLHIVTGGWV
jgi:hypothetical protein